MSAFLGRQNINCPPVQNNWPNLSLYSWSTSNFIHKYCTFCKCFVNGIITSPGFPKNFCENLKVSWLIQVPKGLLIQVSVCVFSFCYMTFSIITQLTRAGRCNSHFLNPTLPNECKLIPAVHGTRHKRAEIKEIWRHKDNPCKWLKLAPTSV